MRPFFLQQIEKLQKLERMLYVLIGLLIFSLLLVLSRGTLKWIERLWIERLYIESVYAALLIATVSTFVIAMLIHRRSGSWLNWLYTLVEESPEALIIADSLGQIVYANEVARRLSSYSLGELTNMKLEELFEGELPEAGEARLRAKTSVEIPVLVSVSEAQTGASKLRVVVAQDITREVEHREAQARLHRRLGAMYLVASTLSEYADLKTILERGLNASMQALSAPVGRIYMLDENGILRLVSYKGISDKFAEEVKELRYGIGNVGTVAMTLKPSIVDYFTSTSEHRHACTREGLRCSAFTALKVGETVYGVLALSYRGMMKWGDEEISLLEAIGNELGVAIQRSKLFENLRVSREWYRNLFMLASDGVCILDPNGKVVDANDVFRKTVEDVYGTDIHLLTKSIYDLVAPHSVYMMRQWMGRLLSGVDVGACEIAIGEENQRWYEARGSLIKDESGNTHVICLMRDVTDRVRRRKIYAAFEELRAKLWRIHRPHELMLTVTEQIAQGLGCSCAILLHSSDGYFSKLVGAISDEAQDRHRPVHQLIISEPKIGEQLEAELDKVLKARKLRVIYASDGEFEWLSQLLGVQLKHSEQKFFILPLSSLEREIGALVLYGRNLTEEDSNLYQSMANEIAALLETAFLCEELSKLNEHLEEAVKERTARLRALYELSRVSQALDDIKSIATKASSIAHSVTPCIAAGLLINIEDEPFASVSAFPEIGDEEIDSLVRELVLAYEHNASTKLDVAKLQLTVERNYGDYKGSETESIDTQVWTLITDDGIIGTFGIARYEHQQLSDEDSKFIASLIDHLTTAVQSEISTRLRERAQLGSALEALGHGMLIIGEDGKVILSNCMAQKLLSEISDDEEKALDALEVGELIKAIETNQMERPSREVMIGSKWYEVRALRLISEKGYINYAISVEDITNQKLTQIQLIHAQRLASIGELASGIAHEINNPLTAIVGFSELLLEREDLPEDIRRDLLRIYNAGLRTREITHRLLSFSRGMSDGLAPKLVDLQAAIDQALDLIAPQFRSMGIELERHYEANLPTAVLSQTFLQQIVLNLVLNAKDAIEMSGKGSKVIVRVSHCGENHIDIVVEDDGPGMQQEVLERIFDPFFTTKPPGRGTGLGLSIVHRYVQEMGGKIAVWSQVGVGSKFTITLPIAKPEEVEATKEIAEEHREVLRYAKSVLIIDDEPSVCAFVEEAFKPRGFEAVSLTDPREALGLLERKFFDIILLDLRMPYINGLQLYELINERMPEQAKRIVFLTGDLLSKMAQKAQEVGAPMLLKPLTASELFSFVQEFIARFAPRAS